jgi:sugar/nucleoside kinase (ribokinase family)
MSGNQKFDVAVVGDCCLDLVMYGLPDALPPERELLADNMAMRPGGSATITAHNLSCLGNSVGFVFASSDDSFGRFCAERLAAARVDTTGAALRQGGTTGVTVLLQHAQARHMFTYAGVTNSLRLEDIDLDYICRARHFHMASYYLQSGLTPEIPELLRRIRERGLTISMDPNNDPANTWNSSILDALKWVDVFMPNESEARRITGEDNLETAIENLRQRVPLLVIKQGEAGVSAFAANREWQIPACPVRTVDAIGAGDSFDAGFVHGHIRRWDVETCLRFGALTGAWSTTASGGTDAFFHPESMEKMWDAWSVHENGVIS